MEKIKVYVVLSGDNDGKDMGYYGDPMGKQALIEGIFKNRDDAVAMLSKYQNGHTDNNTIIYWMEEYKID